MDLVHEKSAPLPGSRFRLTCFARVSSSRSEFPPDDGSDPACATNTALETIYSIQCKQCPKFTRCDDKEDCISCISQHAGTTGCFVKATGCADEEWKELFNQKLYDCVVQDAAVFGVAASDRSSDDSEGTFDFGDSCSIRGSCSSRCSRSWGRPDDSEVSDGCSAGRPVVLH